MSDQPTTHTESTSPTNGTGTWTSTVTAPTPVTVTPAEIEQEPPWLNKRLERAQREGVANFLKELGTSEEQLKGVKVGEMIEAEKQRRDAEKSELQKAQEALAEAQPKITGYETLLKAFGEIVEAEIQAIPEAHRERASSLLSIAGDDPIRKMQVIRELKPLFGSDEAKPQKQPPRNIDGAAGAATSGRKGTEPAPADALRTRFRIGR